MVVRWQVNFWYVCYYAHTSRDSVSAEFGIFMICSDCSRECSSEWSAGSCCEVIFLWPTKIDNQPIYGQTKVGMFMIFFYHSFHFDPFSPPSFFSFSLVSTILCWSTWGSRENCKDYVLHETDISAKCVAKRIGLLWTVWVLDLQDQWTCWTVFPESYMVRMGHQHR